jgi:Calpain family cysteine protease
MLRPTMSDSSPLASRKVQVSHAFLAHRLTPGQLHQLMGELESDDKTWADTFEKLTLRGNDTAAVEFVAGSDESIQRLGLREQFEQLADDKVWTREERALYRALAHPAKSEKKEDITSSGEPGKLLETFQQQQQNWDRNGDFRLADRELDLAMSGGYYGEGVESANDPELAATLCVLRRYDAYLQSADPYDGPGVSLHDMLLMEGAGTDLLAQMKRTVTTEYTSYLEKAAALQPTKAIEQERIEPLTIHQGTPGSCVLLSTAAGTDPSRLSSMFKQLDEGRVEVTFGDGVVEVVNEPTLAERLYHAKGQDSERWPALLEKAMLQRLYTENRTRYESVSDAIDGIEPEVAIKALTGLEADKRNLDELSVVQAGKVLQELTAQGGPVICGSRPTANGDFISVEDLHNGLMSGHAYTVLGYDAELGSVTLRNPWGHREWIHQESPDDGIFEMPLRDFYSSFRWVAGTSAEKIT